VAVSAGAYEWVDVARQIALCRDVKWKNEKTEKDDGAH